jgi:hypothetical protein
VRGEIKIMPVYRHTTAQGHHASSKASKTRITSGTAGEWRGPLVSIFRRRVPSWHSELEIPLELNIGDGFKKKIQWKCLLNR